MSKKNTAPTQKKNTSHAIHYAWLLVFVPFLLIVVFIFLAALGWVGFMPSLKELENPKSSLASEIISADGQILGKYYVENRSSVSFKDMSPNVIDALVATEDVRFYTHAGIDARALGRAIIKPFIGGNGGGASTITQQLAKNLFPREKMNKFSFLFRKIKEWIIAVKLEYNYTKEEILAMYLNTVDFGQNSYGIKAAALTYFNTTPNKLTKPEAAMLIGLLKAPTYYSPVRNPENALRRRNTVLGQMRKAEKIDEEEFLRLKATKIELDYNPEDHNTGIATYFREYVRDEMRNWCKEHKKSDGSNYDLYKDGLRIYTTIDSRMQRYAEEAVNEWLGKELQPLFFKHWAGKKTAPFSSMNVQEIEDLMRQAMKRSDRYRIAKQADLSDAEIEKQFNTKIKMKLFNYKKDRDTLLSPMDSLRYYKHFLQTGFMALDPSTGYVKAWVGGVNYKYFKYDHVRSGARQVGSTFKPIVYALAMQEGYSPCYQVPNVPVTISNPGSADWTPSNSDGKYGGMMSLKRGLATSTNTVSAFIIKQFGAQAVVEMAKKLGITSHLDAVPSICLGTPDITVYEMAGAMATFANKGVYTKPLYITRIEDKNGNVIEEFIPQKHEALSEETAYLTVNLMKGVVEHGTGVRLRFRYGLNTPIAGKTGTTQNNSDGWFVGLTPELAGAVWVGCEDRSAHFRSTDLGQGATMALPIWAKFMQKVYADKKLKISTKDFERPKELKIETDCDKFNKENNLEGEFNKGANEDIDFDN
ncbi:MAG: penicillin-binding protein [Bacteroidia bacterium]|nr:penicillin-binding protein [Bacteroidia bacterium]